MTNTFHCAWASRKEVDRSTTHDRNEAEVMARIISRGNEDQSSQIVLVMAGDTISSIFHDGEEFTRG